MRTNPIVLNLETRACVSHPFIPRGRQSFSSPVGAGVLDSCPTCNQLTAQLAKPRQLLYQFSHLPYSGSCSGSAVSPVSINSADLDRSRGDLQLDLRNESGLSHSPPAGSLCTADMADRLW